MWNSYYQELTDKGDRAAAVVGAAMLDTSLCKAIQHHSDVSSGSTKRLHDFNSKIAEAYRLNIISEIQKQVFFTSKMVSLLLQKCTHFWKSYQRFNSRNDPILTLEMRPPLEVIESMCSCGG
jgi:hypothetical protein